MSNAIAQNANVYTEMSSLKALKGQVKAGDQEAIEKVAKQFEAIFLQMMLSGMRKTVQVDEEYGNDKAMYYDLFDKQVAMNLSERGGIGLAKLMMAQPGIADKLTNTAGRVPDGLPAVSNMATSKTADADMIIQPHNETNSDTIKKAQAEHAGIKFGSPVEFMQTVWNVASDVITKNGFDPKVLIAQAALETGWGKHIAKTVKGDSSFNLFGIKSGRQWQGDEVIANTLEFKDGAMYQSREGFRSYNSIRESVKDYIDFVKGNQRYQHALKNLQDPEAYMKSLQQAGYATDPHYSSKVLKIMNSKEFGNFFNSATMRGI